MSAKPKKQEPQGTPESAETVKGLIGGFSGIETFNAKGTGTVYGIIAKAKGLALAIAPKIAPAAGFIGIYTRVRIQKLEDWANLEEGYTLFGFPEMKERSDKHASCEVFVAVALSPATPFEVGKTIEANCILESLVAAVQKRVEDAGQKLIVTPEALVIYHKNVFETILPTEAPKQITKFPVCIGDKAIAEHAKALYKEFGPQKKPKSKPSEEGGEES